LVKNGWNTEHGLQPGRELRVPLPTNYLPAQVCLGDP